MPNNTIDITYQPPTNDAWKVYDGRKCATDTTCVVFEGEAHPTQMHAAFGEVMGWVEQDIDIAKVIDPGADKPHPGRFAVRFEPMFQAADRVASTTGGEHSGAILFRDGKVVGAVLPMMGESDGPYVDADGMVWTPVGEE